jgi:alpha-glucosidase
MLGFAPHHDGSELYVPDQQPSVGDRVDVFVRVHSSDPVDAVALRSVADGEPRFTRARVVHKTGEWTWWRAVLRLVNPCTSYRFLLTGEGSYRWLNASGIHMRDVPDAADFRVLAGDHPPDWIRNSVVYQIFPDRFACGVDGRTAPDWAVAQSWDDPVVGQGPETPVQWYGGDLPGIEAHLDHVESLNASVIYLTPIFPGRSNHRYDASTFDHVDPVLGGDEALASLVRTAHGRGLRVIGDLTTNHTGDGHEWFTHAQASATSAEAGFYSFLDHPGQYESWLGVPSLPKLDWRSDELRRRFVSDASSPVRRWLSGLGGDGSDGLDGWRVDVANMTGRSGSVDLAHEVARLVRSAVSSTHADAWLVAEHMHDAALDLQLPDGWHGAMNYAGFTKPIWAWFGPASPYAWFFGQPGGSPHLPGGAIAATMREASGQMPWRSLVHSMNSLDSHDTPRFRTHAGRSAQLAAAGLLYTLPGVPAVFAGQELGLEGTNGEDARRPMPWDDRSSWDLPVFEAYSRYGAARASSDALRRGGLRWISIGDDALTFVRETSDEQVLVHVARSAHPPVHVPVGAFTSVGEPETLFGADLKASASELILPNDGPAAHAWRL